MLSKTKLKTLRQQEIVNAARKIIASRGIKNLTVRQIAEEVRITDGALYRHFDNKKGMIELLIRDIEDTLLNNIQEAAKKSDDNLQKLKNIFFSHLSYTEQRKGLTFIIINETLCMKDRKLQKQMYRVVQKYLKIIETIFSNGINSGNFKKGVTPVCASLAFFGMVQAAVTIWALQDFDPSLMSNRLKGLFDIYTKGVLIQ